VFYFTTTTIYNLSDIDEEGEHDVLFVLDDLSNGTSTFLSSSINKNNDKWWKGRDDNLTRRQTHPDMGALFDGQSGMIVNPSVARLETLDIQANDAAYRSVEDKILCPSNDDYAVEGKGANIVLQKIKGGLSKSIQFLQSFDPSKNNNHANNGNNATIGMVKSIRKRKSRILCMVYTFHTAQDNHTNVRTQARTWGKRCDGFIAASNFTDHSVGAIDLLHMGNEEYGNMWQKVRSMWAYVHNNYRNEYDFFYICGDDVYVAVENLRAYLDGPDVERLENGHVDGILKYYKYIYSKKWEEKRPRPLLLGTPFMYRKCPCPDGGAGYVMNPQALDLFYSNLPYHLHNVTDPREDLFVGLSFCSQGMYLSDSRNSLDDGWRFWHGASLAFSGKGAPNAPKYLEQLFGFPFMTEMDAISEQQISFHLKVEKERLFNHENTIADLMYRYEAVLYDLCEKRI
jgi:hypothetical protein